MRVSRTTKAITVLPPHASVVRKRPHWLWTFERRFQIRGVRMADVCVPRSTDPFVIAHQRQQSGDAQEMRDAVAGIHNPELAALRVRQVEGTNELAYAGGIDVGYAH